MSWRATSTPRTLGRRLASWNHFQLNRLSRGLADMYGCAIGLKFRDEVRVHVSKGLDALPTEQVLIPWETSHHREPAILIGFRNPVKVGPISLHRHENGQNVGHRPISAIDHAAIELGCAGAHHDVQCS